MILPKRTAFGQALAALDFAPTADIMYGRRRTLVFFFLSGKMSLIGDRTGIKLLKELTVKRKRGRASFSAGQKE